MTVGSGKRQAAKQLKAVGTEFVTGFMSTHQGAIPLRSKDPGLCWKASGQVAFAIIGEFSGPNMVQDDAPLLFRLRTNLYPPPAIYYHLKSPKVRHKLGIQATPIILSEPALEVTGTPDEIAKLGQWLTAWLDSYFYQRPIVPTPPFQICSVTVDKQTYQDVLTDVMSLGPDWRFKMNLWTPAALESWNAYLRK